MGGASTQIAVFENNGDLMVRFAWRGRGSDARRTMLTSSFLAKRQTCSNYSLEEHDTGMSMFILICTLESTELGLGSTADCIGKVQT